MFPSKKKINPGFLQKAEPETRACGQIVCKGESSQGRSRGLKQHRSRYGEGKHLFTGSFALLGKNCLRGQMILHVMFRYTTVLDGVLLSNVIWGQNKSRQESKRYTFTWHRVRSGYPHAKHVAIAMAALNGDREDVGKTQSLMLLFRN